MRQIQTIMLTLLCAALAGCGGVDEDVIDEFKTPTVVVSGNTPLLDAQISIRRQDGTLLATTTTNGAGDYEATFELSQNTLLRIDVDANSNSTMKCLAVACPNSNFGQSINGNALQGLKLTSYRHVLAPPNWETEQVVMPVSFVSTLVSTIVEKRLLSDPVRSFEQTKANANAIVATSLNLLPQNSAPQSTFDLMSFDNTNQSLALMVSNDALTATSDESSMEFRKLNTLLAQMPMSEQLLPDAFGPSIAIANSHKDRSAHIKRLLIYGASFQDKPMKDLMNAFAMNEDIDVDNLLALME